MPKNCTKSRARKHSKAQITIQNVLVDKRFGFYCLDNFFVHTKTKVIFIERQQIFVVTCSHCTSLNVPATPFCHLQKEAHSLSLKQRFAILYLIKYLYTKRAYDCKRLALNIVYTLFTKCFCLSLQNFVVHFMVRAKQTKILIQKG